MRARCAAAALWALACLPGCYFYDLAAGQLALINEQQPLLRALADENDLSRERMLRRVADVRSFAANVMRMRPGRSYSGYYATEVDGITHVLLASDKTSLTAYTWWFPIVGEVPYKSFFDEADARAEQAALDADGYDTWVTHATAYSTLGFFRDPVTTVMMRRGSIQFVEVLLHEMAHGRFYVPGQTDFNEQLASFAGRRGTEQYFLTRTNGDARVMAAVADYFERRDALEALMREGIDEVERLYASGKAEAFVLAERQRVFARLEAALVALYPDEEPERLRVNNARLLQYRRYAQSADYLQTLWDESGRNWARFWQAVEQYARTQLD